MIWCRRGDSNPHELPHTPLKRARLPVPPLRPLCLERFNLKDQTISQSVRSACSPSTHSHCDEVGDACGCGVSPASTGEAVVVADGAGAVVVAGALLLLCVCGGADGVVGCGVSDVYCKTERVPVIAGSDNIRATSMNTMAAPIVIFAKRVCVPRGPNAVLETPLEKSAPASALPGCNSTATTKIMHAKIKMLYKT